MSRNAPNLAVVAAIAGLALGAVGCGGPELAIRHATDLPDTAVEYDSATFQLARGGRVQIIFFRRRAAPIGEQDPDFELTTFDLPERDYFGWARADDVDAWRWVHETGPDGRVRDRLWRASSGEARMRFADAGRRLHLDLLATMTPMGTTPGGVYVMSGDVEVREDIPRTQGLLNRYGQWLRRVVKEAREAPGTVDGMSPSG